MAGLQYGRSHRLRRRNYDSIGSLIRVQVWYLLAFALVFVLAPLPLLPSYPSGNRSAVTSGGGSSGRAVRRSPRQTIHASAMLCGVLWWYKEDVLIGKHEFGDFRLEVEEEGKSGLEE